MEERLVCSCSYTCTCFNWYCRFSFLDFNEEAEELESSTNHLELPSSLIVKSPGTVLPHQPSPLLKSNQSHSSYQQALKVSTKENSDNHCNSSSSSDEDMFVSSTGLRKTVVQ